MGHLFEWAGKTARATRRSRLSFATWPSQVFHMEHLGFLLRRGRPFQDSRADRNEYMGTVDHPRMLRVAEVAAHLSLSKQTVRRMIARGDLPFIQFRRGGAVRVPAEALEKLDWKEHP